MELSSIMLGLPLRVEICLSLCFRQTELPSRTNVLVSGNLTVPILVSVNPSAAIENSHVAVRQAEIGQEETSSPVPDTPPKQS